MAWPERLVPSSVDGRGVLRAAWWGTGGFTVMAVAITVVGDPLAVPFAVVSLGLLAVGSGAMLWAFQRALQRSRHQVIAVGGLYFLAGCAPRSVRFSMMGALVVELVVALATASARPYTAAAFGILVPVYALGLSGAWGAAHGEFPPRPTDGRSPPRHDPRRNGDDV